MYATACVRYGIWGCADCLFYQERTLAHIVATVFNTEGFAYN